MSQEPTYSYDEESDVLYVSFGAAGEEITGIELNENMLLRVDRAQKRAVGLTLMDFSVLVQPAEYGPRTFPLTGLHELEPEWQDLVIDLLTSPPVNQILKVASLTPSFAVPTPVATVEKPSITVAV